MSEIPKTGYHRDPNLRRNFGPFSGGIHLRDLRPGKPPTKVLCGRQEVRAITSNRNNATCAVCLSLSLLHNQTGGKHAA